MLHEHYKVLLKIFAFYTGLESAGNADFALVGSRELPVPQWMELMKTCNICSRECLQPLAVSVPMAQPGRCQSSRWDGLGPRVGFFCCCIVMGGAGRARCRDLETMAMIHQHVRGESEKGKA